MGFGDDLLSIPIRAPQTFEEAHLQEKRLIESIQLEAACYALPWNAVALAIQKICEASEITKQSCRILPTMVKVIDYVHESAIPHPVRDSIRTSIQNQRTELADKLFREYEIPKEQTLQSFDNFTGCIEGLALWGTGEMVETMTKVGARFANQQLPLSKHIQTTFEGPIKRVQGTLQEDLVLVRAHTGYSPHGNFWTFPETGNALNTIEKFKNGLGLLSEWKNDLSHWTVMRISAGTKITYFEGKAAKQISQGGVKKHKFTEIRTGGERQVYIPVIQKSPKITFQTRTLFGPVKEPVTKLGFGGYTVPALSVPFLSSSGSLQTTGTQHSVTLFSPLPQPNLSFSSSLNTPNLSSPPQENPAQQKQQPLQDSGTPKDSNSPSNSPVATADKVLEQFWDYAGTLTGVKPAIKEIEALNSLLKQMATDPINAPKKLVEALIGGPEKKFLELIETPKSIIESGELFAANPLASTFGVVTGVLAMASLANELLALLNQSPEKALKAIVKMPINSVIGVYQLGKSLTKNPIKAGKEITKMVLKMPVTSIKGCIRGVKNFVGLGRKKQIGPTKEELNALGAHISVLAISCYRHAEEQWWLFPYLSATDYYQLLVKDWEQAVAKGIHSGDLLAYLKAIEQAFEDRNYSTLRHLAPKAHPDQPLAPLIVTLAYEQLALSAANLDKALLELKAHSQRLEQNSAQLEGEAATTGSLLDAAHQIFSDETKKEAIRRKILQNRQSQLPAGTDQK